MHIVNLIRPEENIKYQTVGNIRVINEKVVPFLKIIKKELTNKRLQIK